MLASLPARLALAALLLATAGVAIWYRAELAPWLVRVGRAAYARIERELADLRDWFARTTPTFRGVYWVFLALVLALYCRSPATNYIFDEQEALLANPYVNQVGFRYSEAIYRDFWGLPANASIGSYRPVPNYLWRGLVEVGERAQLVFERVPQAAKDRLAQAIAPEPVPELDDVARRSWFQHLYNLALHAACGALFTAMAFRITREKRLAWLTGLTFACSAILTEAVSGVVGLADVLGGLSALLALSALALRAQAMPFGVFLAITLGLFSKESAIVCVPLVPLGALLLSPALHPERPARVVRTVLAAVGALAAFVLYVELRKRWFPSSLPSEHAAKLPLDAPFAKRLAHDFFVWFHQAPLPVDPLNNPLVDAPIDARVGAALRVYLRGLGQVVFPWTLAGDYSFPQEPPAPQLWTVESALGWAAMALPLGAAVGLWVVALRREPSTPLASDEPPAPHAPPAPTAWAARFAALRPWSRPALEAAIVIGSIVLVRLVLGIGPSSKNAGLGDTDPELRLVIPPRILEDALVFAAAGCLAAGSLVEALWTARPRRAFDVRLPVVALGLTWLVVSYIPHSNIPVVLPTVRAERLWYFPVIGTTMVVALALDAVYRAVERRKGALVAAAVPAIFLLFQGGRALVHSFDYRDDLTFWRSTKEAVPNSAKAHLNYSVMIGARGGMTERLAESVIAKQLAPRWAMAHIYTGDVLCRMARAGEAWPHYAEGFKLGPNDKGLIALALQCLFDTKELTAHEAELREIITDHPGSWIAYLAGDILDHGEEQGGVAKEHRPRGYNEGAKKE